MSLSTITKPLYVLLCVFVALASWRFIVLGVEASMAFMLYHATQRPLFFFAHVGFAPLALLLMPFQFMGGLRKKHPVYHRWMGRMYGMAILISGTGGFFMAIHTNAGTVAAIGFGVLDLIWLSTTIRGIWLARAHRIAEHRVWMIRSAALTFAAVTLRLYLPLGSLAGLPFETTYSAVSWLAWVPNLIAVELWRLRKSRPRV